MPFQEIIISNVGSGDSSIMKVIDEADPEDKLKFILADIGTKEHALQDFEKNLTEGKNTTSVFFTHMHKDHIGAIDRLIELHKTKKINLETVYFPSSVLSSHKFIDLLDQDENIELKSIKMDRQECVETLGYLSLYYGNSSPEFRKALDAINKARKEISSKNQNITLELIKTKEEEIKKEIADKEFTREYEEIQGENKKLSEDKVNLDNEIKDLTEKRKNVQKEHGRKSDEYLSLSEVLKNKKIELDKISMHISENEKKTKKIQKHYDNITSEIKNLFQDVKKLNNANVKILSINEAEEDEKIEKYGIEVTCHPLKKDYMREKIRDFVHKGELRKQIGLAEKENETLLEALQREQITTYLIKDCKGSVEKLGFDNEVAGYLIGKMFSHEGNQGNIVYDFNDGKTNYLCSGDMEIIQELQFIFEGKDMSCDLYKLAHHYSRTSNSPFFLEKVLSDSVNAGKKPLFAASMSLSDFLKYEEEIEKKERIMEYTTHRTYNGSFHCFAREGKIFVLTDEIEKDCINLGFENFRKAVTIDDPEKRKVFSEQAEKFKTYSEQGIPVEDFIDVYAHIEYEKYANYVYEHSK